MLVDEPLVAFACRDPILTILAGLDGKLPSPTPMIKGVYEIAHFGSSDFLRGVYEPYPSLGSEEEYIGPYGVCDGVDNLLTRIPELVDAPHRYFVVTMTAIRRKPENKGRGGGWRWHKWGAYIGTQCPTTEYIDDEPVIDLVYVYHVYEKIVIL